MSAPAPQKFSLGQQSYQTASFVRRPGFGSVGMKIAVVANHYVFKSLGNATIYHYDVTTDPEPTKNLARKVWARFEEDHASRLKITCGYDGVKNVFTPNKLPQETMTFTVVLPPPADRPTRRDGSPNTKEYKMTWRLVGELAMSDLNAYLQGKTAISNNIITLHQAIDVMFRQMPTRNMLPAGRSFFDPALPATKLSGGVDLLSGVFLSARMGTGRMTLNVDTAYTAFYRPINVVEFCAQVLGRPVNQLMGQELTPSDHKRIDKALRMVAVSTSHRQGKTRYGILKLSRTSADKSMFTLNPPAEQVQDDGGAGRGRGGDAPRGRGRGGATAQRGPAGAAPGGRQVSVTQYFAETYNMQLRFKNLPCLVVGSQQKQTFLPMEIATIEPGQKFRGKLSEDQTSEVIKIAAKKPLERKDQIAKLVSRLALDQDPYIKSIGISVDQNPMMLDGRILPTPQLDVGGRPMVPRDGAWNFAGLGVKQGARISSIGVLSFVNPRMMPEGQIADILEGFFQESSRMGLQYNPIKKTRESFPIHIAQPRLEGVEAALQSLWKATGDQFQAYPELFIVVLPRRETALYAEVKRIGETVLGVPTQCLVKNKIERANPQYWANVALKVNTKVKGPSFNFHLKQSKFLTEPTMLIGADVTHPAPGTNQASIAAMVGSLDPNCLRYQTVVKMQPLRQEEIVDAGGMFRDLLKQYQAFNGQRLPKRVIVYRDGVSEGQFALVRDAEVQAMRNVLAELNSSSTKLTFVVVQKRHHTRFFASNPRDVDRSGNIKAGLVIDNGVTNPTDFDFFLQSQAGLQGTSRPTRYVVLHDEMNWTPDDLQLFTYHQCYTYARCTRSVSVAPAAYYAHLACFRARHHVKFEGSEASLATTSSEGVPQEVAPLHPKLGNSMYFM
ncbi:Piwi domain-domain-containing protein [Catenaria anguillulae PL171]|uniref:Piwi domain-domain-containing protein n=1 Tax=Catenaria anguillulae PL171 TaxID=765915 RepID=A0A1Y2I419_9FUNG|nr:Piwi domain-domain-containing protein [Catenaria anguillulae PL171]